MFSLGTINNRNKKLQILCWPEIGIGVVRILGFLQMNTN